MDTSLFHFFHSFAGRSAALDSFIVFLAVYLPVLIVTIAVLYLLLSRYPRSATTTGIVSGVIAVITSRWIVGTFFRWLIHRPRPFIPLNFSPLFPEASSSFPSGHALTLFPVATLVYFYNKPLGIGLYIASIIACVGRVAAGVHYPSDILAGAVIGTVCAYLAIRFVAPRVHEIVKSYV